MVQLKSPILYITAVLLLAARSSSTEKNRNSCPEECRCTTLDAITTVHCTSINSLTKLSPKELANIKSLDISNTTTSLIDKKLVRKLVNLEKLNVANNRISDIKHFHQLHKLSYLNLRSNLIKTFIGKHLPKSLKTLDISYNYIKELPNDLTSCPSLSVINVSGNSFSCSHESLDNRDSLVEKNIKIIGRATCSTPSKLKGKIWNFAVDFDEYFKLHHQDDVQGDDANIDIGSGAGSGSHEIFPSSLSTISPEDTDFNFEETNDTTDEGSGFVDGPSTEDGKYTTVTDNFAEITTEVVEIPIQKSVGAAVESPKHHELTTERLEPSVDTHKTVTEKSLGTNIFLAIIIIILIALVVYAVKKNKERKRRRQRQRREDLEKQNAGIELMPKSSLPNEKQNGNAETSPLINKPEEKETELYDVKSEPQKNGTGSQEKLTSSPYLNASPYDSNRDVLSVKVKASEIPDSIPRTPILVDRRKTSDGQNIIVTPNLNLRASNGD